MARSSSGGTTTKPRSSPRRPSEELPAPIAAKRRASGSPNGTRRPSGPALPPPSATRPPSHLNTQHLYDAAAIVFVAIALVLLASFFPGRPVGRVGEWLSLFGRFWMGSAVVILPPLLLALAVSLAVNRRRALHWATIGGMAGAVVAVLGFLHLFTWEAGALFASTSARWAALSGPRNSPLLMQFDGGVVGAVVTVALQPLGLLGTGIVLAALAAISAILVTGETLAGAASRVPKPPRRMPAESGDEPETALARPAGRLRIPFLQIGGPPVADDEDEDEEERPVLVTEQGRTLAVTPALPEASNGNGAANLEPSSRSTRSPRSRRERSGDGDTPSAPAPVSDALDAPPSNGAATLEPPPMLRRVEPQVTVNAPRVATMSQDPDAEYQLPSTEILDPSPPERPSPPETQENIAVLERTLSEFNVEAQVVEIADGPTVTRYEIRLAPGIRVRKIVDLADNIQLSLAARAVRVEAPIPGKSAIGIEVPKKEAAVVTLRECLETETSVNHPSKLAFVLGKDVSGAVCIADLTRMPHLLVAGSTNSGKSVCLNVLIASMLFRARPDEVKFLMVDPKRVELTLFDGIPHLLHPVIKNVKQAAGILRWAVQEMERRYDLFNQALTRNIDGYNAKCKPEERLPYIVIIVDELADLMMQQGPEVEMLICRLAQLARATGMHLVLATQRPSVDIITGTIKANISSRISFAVTSQIDSRTILDAKGAENLVGRGDMLFKPIDAHKPTRVQGALLKETEVIRLVEYLKTQGRPEYTAVPLTVDSASIGEDGPRAATKPEENENDDLLEPAAKWLVTAGHASTSGIQRKFRIGYTRAARLVEMMEARGIVGPLDGPKGREILMNREQVDASFRRERNNVIREGTVLPEDEREDKVPENDDPFTEPDEE